MSKRSCVYSNENDIRKFVYYMKGSIHFRKHDMPEREFYMGCAKEFSFNQKGGISLSMPYIVGDHSCIKFITKIKRKRGITYRNEIEVLLCEDGDTHEIN